MGGWLSSALIGMAAAGMGFALGAIIIQDPDPASAPTVVLEDAQDAPTATLEVKWNGNGQTYGTKLTNLEGTNSQARSMKFRVTASSSVTEGHQLQLRLVDTADDGRWCGPPWDKNNDGDTEDDGETSDGKPAAITTCPVNHNTTLLEIDLDAGATSAESGAISVTFPGDAAQTFTGDRAFKVVGVWETPTA